LILYINVHLFFDFMSDFGLVPFFLLFSVVIATVTAIITLFFDGFKTLRYRRHLPLLSGLLLVVLVLVVNAHGELIAFFPSPGDLIGFSPWLLLPFFILAPLPYIEHRAGRSLNRRSVFCGALLAALCYCLIWQYGNYLVEYWNGEGLFYAMCSTLPASLIFLAISSCHWSPSEVREECRPVPAPEVRSSSLISNRRTNLTILAGVLVFCIALYLLGSLGYTGTAGGFNVYSVQESEIGNRTVLHLTDRDFDIFPRIRSIIRDGHLNGCPDDSSSTCIASGWYAFNERYQMYDYSVSVLAYGYRYFSLKKTWISDSPQIF
jgi:hypothetical protein